MQLILLFFRSPKSTAAAFSLPQPPSFGQENETRPVSCIETTSESAVDSRPKSFFLCRKSASDIRRFALGYPRVERAMQDNVTKSQYASQIYLSI